MTDETRQSQAETVPHIVAAIRAKAAEPMVSAQVETIAKHLAEWIGYPWDGIGPRSASDRGIAEWSSGGTYQGGQADLMRLAQELLAAAQPQADGVREALEKFRDQMLHEASKTDSCYTCYTDLAAHVARRVDNILAAAQRPVNPDTDTEMAFIEACDEIGCANGNDLPEGEQCAYCGREGNAIGLRAAVIRARGRAEPPTCPVRLVGGVAQPSSGPPSPRAGGIGVDWWAESVKLYRQNQKLRKALQEQHDWHLAQGDQDFGEGITLNMADEYADSSMCERTTAALATEPPASPISSTVRGGK